MDWMLFLDCLPCGVKSLTRQCVKLHNPVVASCTQQSAPHIFTTQPAVQLQKLLEKPWFMINTARVALQLLNMWEEI
jgi:hypothetical protein